MMTLAQQHSPIVGEEGEMRTEMRRRYLGMLSLAVAVILLIGEVPEAACTDGGSINVTTSVVEFIGDEELLMDSEVNARLLADKSYISYQGLKKGAVCNGKAYKSQCTGLQVNRDNRNCLIYQKCRQG
ncbi:hypothetical protein SLA2020_063620 [Shorea laevis]